MTLPVSNNSIFIESQLPEYIHSDSTYATFVAFLNAYYEWLETQNQVTYHAKRVQSYIDVEQTTNDFLNYFRNSFLPYIPKDALADPRKLARIAKEFYQTKGTEKSFRFLFRAIYGKEIDIYLKKDNVLRASGGNWFIPQSITVDSTAEALVSAKSHRILGLTSKTSATVEDVAIDVLNSKLYISQASGGFTAGETLIVTDAALNPLLVEGATVTAKIIGSVTGITLDGQNRGKLYQAGDPVIITGGHNPSASNPVDAVAEITSATAGSLDRIYASKGGYGYNLYSNTLIEISGSGTGANVVVNLVDKSQGAIGNISFSNTTISALSPNTTTIGAANYGLKGPSITVNSGNSIANSISTYRFELYGISGIDVVSRGSNFDATPTIFANSRILLGNTYYSVAAIGALGPVQVANTGTGYANGDFLTFTGGSGIGANANVVSVHSVTGAIQIIEYRDIGYGLGGTLYGRTDDPSKNAFPTIGVTSTAGQDASLYVDGIMGSGAEFIASTDGVGIIRQIKVTNAGTDYISQPNVSLRVADLWITGYTNPDNPPVAGEVVYQGATEDTATFKGTVYSTTNYTGGGSTIRIYDYLGTANNKKQLAIYRPAGNTVLNMSNTVDTFYTANATHIYGDGSAKATAKFTNFTSITTDKGLYLDTSSLLNELDVVIEDLDNNDFTYELSIESSLKNYQEVLLGLLHPAGTHYVSKNAIKANGTNFVTLDSDQGTEFTYTDMIASMSVSGSELVSNTITITSAPAYIDTIFYPSDYISLYDANSNINVYSRIEDVNATSNTITIDDYTPLIYGNVAYGVATSGANTINVTSFTTSYNLINNGEYSNTNWLVDIVKANDYVSFGANSGVYQQVQSVDYANNLIYVTNKFNSSNGWANANITVKKAVSTSNIGYIRNDQLIRLQTEDGYLLETENGDVLYL